jgi:hypothetical protein
MSEQQHKVERQKLLIIVTKKLFALTVLCLIGLSFLMYCLKFGTTGGRTYLIIYVFIAGLIGGFVSIQQRLPKTDIIELRELSQSWSSLLLIPINGGIFAIVLHILFISGIMEGALFPEYHQVAIDQNNLTQSFADFMTYTFPKDGPNIAKLIFWSFVAGFSERFVPQIIRKTAEKTP